MLDKQLREKIEQLVEQHRDAIVEDLVQLLKFRTISGDETEAARSAFEAETAACLGFLEQRAQAMGFEWFNRENRYAAATLGTSDKLVGLPVHIDVVPPGDGWSHEPFAGQIADGVIYGRGCQDDKGPVVQMLWAMSLVKLLGLPLKRAMRLIVGTTEECGDWPDIKEYVEKETVPEFSIVPDAQFPVINGEKGMINLKVTASLGEDSEADVGGYSLLRAEGGERSNIVPSLAKLVFRGDKESDPGQLQRELERFLKSHPKCRAELTSDAKSHEATISFQGKSAHGSTPEDGHNAVIDMLLLMTESGFISDDESDMAQFLVECGADNRGKRLGVESSHPVVGATTVSLGVLRWSGGKVQATFNVRPTLGMKVEVALANARKAVEEFAEETGFEMQAGPANKTLDAIYVSPEEHPELLDALKHAYTAMTGREATLRTIGGTTYAKMFPNAVCFGPTDPVEETELAHQTNERVSVEHLLRNVRIYTHALAELCGE